MTTVNVRYMVDDVEAAVAFYTTHLGFTLISKTLPAFADVARGDLRLLLSGPTSSAGRLMPDGRRPVPGAGIVFTSSSIASLPRWIDSAPPECSSATTS
jgi:catechol 2,3-dioxygenase-like lactoylglutathione lyase family enzyme